MDPVRPDYERASVTRLVDALTSPAGVDGADWVPRSVGGAGAVVLLVLDGLGWTALEAHRDVLPVLGGLEGGAITTVVPSTTSAALTSITTGLAPGRHGLVGYRMRVDSAILNVLAWTVSGGEAPEPVDVQPHRVFSGRPVPVVTRHDFIGSGFTAAHLRGAAIHAWRAVSSLVEHCRRLVDRGERLVVAYYDGIDQVSHSSGLLDGFFEAELRATDRLVGDLLTVLPERCALVVSSDHGQVHFGREGWTSLGPVAGMVAAYGGDGRFRYLYAAPGARKDLLVAVRERFDSLAWVFSRAELCDEGWLGEERPSRAVRARVGDVVLAAREPVAFTDPTHEHETRMLAGHGSLTPDEMWVPLLARRGSARG